MTTYLEDYLQTIVTLPAEVKRNFELMRELDVDVNALNKDVRQLQKQYLTQARKRLREKKPDEDIASAIVDEDLLGQIDVKRKRAIQKSDEKISIAIQTYDIVDQHIQQLDIDLAKYEEVLRRNGEFEEEKPVKRRSKTTSSERKKQQEESQVTPRFTPAQEDLPIDPNEPVYCICRRVSFGQMVGCDNEDCKYEWFHFECVGLTAQPAGKWFCPECRALGMK